MFTKSALLTSALFLLTGLFSAGCTDHKTCEAAAAHAKECGIPLPANNEIDECTAMGECVSECINKSSCDALTDKDKAGAVDVNVCLEACDYEN